MTRRASGRLLLGAFAVVMALMLSGCVQKTIREIMAEPNRYAHRDVGIVGNVVESYSVLGRGAYRVDDGTGKLWVVSWNSKKGVPRTGSRVGVKGNIRDGFDLGTVVKVPEKVGSGLVMIEKDHKARF